MDYMNEEEVIREIKASGFIDFNRIFDLSGHNLLTTKRVLTYFGIPKGDIDAFMDSAELYV
jgi:hypothetical protein